MRLHFFHRARAVEKARIYHVNSHNRNRFECEIRLYITENRSHRIIAIVTSAVSSTGRQQEPSILSQVFSKQQLYPLAVHLVYGKRNTGITAVTPLAVRRGKCTGALIMSATHNAVGEGDVIQRHLNRVTSEFVRSSHVFEIPPFTLILFI